MDKSTVNRIFREYGFEYRQAYPSTTQFEKKVMRSIEACRTEEMGGRIEVCEECGHKITLYNSCRNRHCPQCQNMKKERWILERKEETLPFTYFHIVFTLPHALNPVVFKNKRALYNLMFSSCSEALRSVSAQEKYFGADIGFFAILHTWGQQLNPHPHLHCAVPGGGYSRSKGTCIHAPYDYLVPVRVLKLRFRSLFMRGLKNLLKSGSLYLAGTRFEDPEAFQKLIDDLYSAEWVVYLKESFKNRESVIEYLARYTHRIAISNNRIVSVDNRLVSFKYRDYKDHNREKIRSMNVLSFMRLFMLHVVLQRFVRIRYFGILANRNKQKAIRECREFYKLQPRLKHKPLHWQDIFQKVTGKSCRECPVCGRGGLIVQEIIMPSRYRAPPAIVLSGNSNKSLPQI
jgi:hypothetical protein